MAKRGRKPVDDPRTNQYRLRLNRKENDILKEACKLTGMSLSDVLREGVRLVVRKEKDGMGTEERED